MKNVVNRTLKWVKTNVNLFNRNEARGEKSLSHEYENRQVLPDSRPTVARRSPDGRPTVNRNVSTLLLRLAATLTLLLTLSVGQMWGNSVGFEESGNGIKYYYSGNASDQSWEVGRDGATKDLSTVTSLYLKEYWIKMYQETTADIYGQNYQHMYYKVHRQAVSAGTTGFTDITANWWSWNGNDGISWRKPTGGNNSQNVNLLSGLGSGKYQMSFYFQQNGYSTWRCPSGSTNNALKWTIAAPAVSGGAVSSNGSGSGTSASPFIVADGNTLTLTATGSQESSDANSVLYVKWGSDSYAAASSTTKTITPTTTKQSITVKLKYYNSADNLSGAETTLTIYYQSTVTPSLNWAASNPISPTSLVSGEDVTLTVVRANSSANITYQYSTNSGSTWTTIATQSAQTCTFTTPSNTGATQSYIFRATMSDGGTKSTGNSAAVPVFGKKTIKVKNSNDWANFYIHHWGSNDANATTWPGETTGISAYGSGQWKYVVIYSCYDGFILNANVSGDANQTVDLSYADYSDGECYAIGTNSGKKTLSNTAATCPSAPTVTTTAAATIRENSATLGGNITAQGNDKITDYGYYYSTNSALSSSNLGVGTKVSVGTDDKSGSYTKSQSSLTANTTYYVIAYATNGQGTSYGSKVNFKTLNTYSVTVSAGTGGTASPSSVTVGQYKSATVTATPAAGYAFKQWNKSGSSVTLSSTTTNPTTVTATGTGSVTAVFKADWYVCGTMSPTAWTTEWADGALTADGDNFSVTLSLAANTTYEFKMYKSSGSNHYWSNSTDINNITATTSGKLLYYDDGTNMSMTTTIAGSYKFTIASPNATHPSLTIEYPSVYAISGGFNSWTETTNLAFTGNDGTYSVSINGSSTNYEFKVLDNGVWYGHSDKTFTATESNVTLSSPNNNIKLKADVYPSGTYTFAYNKSTHKLGVTYPTSYVVTFGKRTGGSTVTAKINNTTAFSSGTKIANGTSVTFSQTAAAGYTFEGWYSASTGGTKLSSDATYTTTISAAKTVYANYTPEQYTVHFNNNGGSGATPGDITVTYGAAYGTLPAGPTPPDADQFAGWFTAQTGGTLVTEETPVSTASEHTLWARFESTFTVTVQYKCGDDVLRPQITTHASETSVAATIIAPNIVGYAFVNWTGSNATFADATNDTTTVHVTAATAVVANYIAVPMVCFKNNLDWDEVYVTFDCYWKDWNGQQVVGNKDKPYYKMTQLGQTDIYYCVIPSAYTDNNYANWKGNIAFDNKGFGDYTTTHLGTYDPFWKGEFLGRADFDPNATMYIPYNGDKETRNEGTYYPTGCWLQYNTTYSGYKINVWNSVNGNSGSLVRDVELRAEVAGSFEFTATGWLDNSATAFGLKLYKDIRKNNNEKWYTNVNNEANTITSATTTLPWSFVGAGSDENWQRCRILPEVSGDYIFTVSFATGRPMVNIEYPVTTGDFRLVYKDLATWNNTHSASWEQISPVFKHKANRVDTASFFISYGSSPSLALEKCTKIEGGVETWTKQSDVSLSSITSKGVYNFTVTQNNTGSSATAAYLGAYTGNYYIRTDASDGGWGSYSKGSNNLTYSEYSLTHGGDFGPYSHYFMRHVDNGQNIKFIIANDYNPCLTDTLVNDTIVNEWISSEANVRFMWYNGSNKIGRAYISGSSIVADRFLVLEGDEHLYDENGNSLTGTHQISGLEAHEMKFFDDQNWIYETTVQANPLERVKLSAKFNNKVQYFYGEPGARTTATTHQLIGGSGSGKYKMRVVYDFKTNRLLAAWLPSTITTEFTIDADVMIIRYHQDDAQQITFSGSGSKLKEVKTVYGAMQFNKYRLNNQSEESGHADLGISQYERDLFFISFPFDVKLNDVFGFGNYGKHWIIEYYDGKGRAEKGFWADSPTNWKFVTPDMKDSYTLKANEGYVLALDLDKLTLESSVWNYGVENVYLYFPSTANVNDIEATSRTITIDQTGYQCTIDRRTNKNVPDVNNDRRVADSYWHLIGVPSYANASNSTSSTWTGTVPDLDPAVWTTKAPFVYDWNPSTNKCGVISTTSSTFKPMRAYLTQYAKTTIEWSSVNATPQSVAARRSTQHVSNYEFRLELQYDGKEADRTFVSLREDEEVTNDFDFSFDLCKELYGSFTPISQIYTIAGEGIPAAGNCLPLETEKETSVPVSVVTTVAGAYTFAMPDGTEGLSVTLVDNVTGTHTNLALGDYTVELEAGTYDNRFTLVIDPRTTTTAVETVGSEGTDAPRKVFINGLMYIQRGNALYDTTGRKVE